MENKTYEEMLELAVEMFGEDATITYSNGWIINTGVEEPEFDWETVKGTPAYRYFIEESGDLERWAWKNSCSSESTREIVQRYNDYEERHYWSYVDACRKALDKYGVDYDPEDPDGVIELAREEIDRQYAEKLRLDNEQG